MGFDHDGPEGANFKGTGALQAVRWEDKEEVRQWLAALREVVNDLGGAGLDQARRKRHRKMSRQEASQQIDEASERADRLIEAAEAGFGRLLLRQLASKPQGGDEPSSSSSGPEDTPPDGTR
jgi:hypothetical protein